MLIEQRHLRPIKAYRVPECVVEGINTRFASGNWDFGLPDSMLFHHSALSGRFARCDFPDAAGNPSESPATWPLLQLREVSQPTFWDVGKSIRDCDRGILWMGNHFITSFRNKYTWSGNGAAGLNWASVWDCSNGLAAATEMYRFAPGGDRNLFGGFITRLPADRFETEIGFSGGGYELLGSSLGPSLLVHHLTRGESTRLFAYEKGAPCPRDPAYELIPHDTPFNLHQLFMPRSGNVGFWQSDRCYQGAWIENEQWRGCVFPTRNARGTCDYRTQDSTPDKGAGTEGGFTVGRPDLFYSSANSPWNGHGNDPSLETWNAGKMPGGCYCSLFVYDPLDLGKPPRQFEMPRIHGGWWRGLRWDGQLLWAWLHGCWNDSKRHGLVAFSLEQSTAVSNAPLGLPQGWSLSASGELVKD